MIILLSFWCEKYFQYFVCPSGANPFRLSEFCLHPVMKTILVIDFAPIKRILIPKHGNYFLVESSTLKAFESGLQLKESGILLKIIMQNPSSTDKDRNSVRRIQNPRLGIQNSRLSSNWTPLQDVLGGITFKYIRKLLILYR